MSLAPGDRLRRCFLYRELAALDASFDEVNGHAAAMTCGGDAAQEIARARSLGLCDLSALRRIGYKGWNTAAWLGEQIKLYLENFWKNEDFESTYKKGQWVGEHFIENKPIEKVFRLTSYIPPLKETDYA